MIEKHIIHIILEILCSTFFVGYVLYVVWIVFCYLFVLVLTVIQQTLKVFRRLGHHRK